jgi:receptor protein-tyrosine kinase
VILIEADLRRPVIAKALRLTVDIGTDDLVAGTATLDEALEPFTSNGAELQLVVVRVASDLMAERLSFDFCQELVAAAKEQADFVVIDSPPISAVVDALPLARFVDDVLIVGRIGVSRLAQLSELFALLVNFGSEPLGVVLVGGSPPGGSAYYADPRLVMRPPAAASLSMRPNSDLES